MEFFGHELDLDHLPGHVGIIMDGNGRWAKKRGLERVAGHEKGYRTLRKLMEFNRELKIPVITVYAFSTENWKRPQDEVDFLMDLAREIMPRYSQDLLNDNVRLVVSGSRESVPEDLRRMIDEAEEKTRHCDDYLFNVAFNYGGRKEIVDACRRIAEQVQEGQVQPADISERNIAQHLYSPEIPDADLIIRTSGEYRLSNFLLWQSAYSEFYFTEQLWPDFSPREFVKALHDYQNRKRRFGSV